MSDTDQNNILPNMAGNTRLVDQLWQVAEELHGVAMTIRLIAEQMDDSKDA